jgi:S1-C subfamily serine protease
VNGKSVRNPKEMAQALRQFKGGDTVSVGFLRDSTKRKVTVTLNGNQETEA